MEELAIKIDECETLITDLKSSVEVKDQKISSLTSEITALDMKVSILTSEVESRNDMITKITDDMQNSLLQKVEEWEVIKKRLIDKHEKELIELKNFHYDEKDKQISIVTEMATLESENIRLHDEVELLKNSNLISDCWS